MYILNFSYFNTIRSEVNWSLTEKYYIRVVHFCNLNQLFYRSTWHTTSNENEMKINESNLYILNTNHIFKSQFNESHSPYGFNLPSADIRRCVAWFCHRSTQKLKVGLIIIGSWNVGLLVVFVPFVNLLVLSSLLSIMGQKSWPVTPRHEKGMSCSLTIEVLIGSPTMAVCRVSRLSSEGNHNLFDTLADHEMHNFKMNSFSFTLRVGCKNSLKIPKG